ncbi:MAG: alpha/beta hydrolase fold protein [Caulobacteraceae bacterium]|nr:alpha/beta hydrolase fold protein [Caulobacteraceae bacterium]
MIQSRMRLGDFDVRIWSGGAGPPLVYLHGFEHHPGAAPYLQRLSGDHQILAPEHPGFGASTGFDRLTDLQDLILYYRALVEGWGRGPVDLVGHCLGGMFAAELAVLAPQLVRRLVLVDPYGLWLDDAPLPDPFLLVPAALAAVKWRDPACAARETSAFDPALGDTAAEFRTINLTAASKFMWPIPDRGLARRLPYLTAPTLVIHGDADGLTPPAYEAAWAAALPHARTAVIADAGHLPMVEAEGAFIDLVEDFLNEAPWPRVPE